MNYKELLKTIIDNIESNNYSYDCSNGGFSYSKEITAVFKILNDDSIRKIYDENIDNYTYNDKKELDQKRNPKSYSLVDCVIYFYWVWHLDGSGIASGIIFRRIKEGKYLEALKRLYDVI